LSKMNRMHAHVKKKWAFLFVPCCLSDRKIDRRACHLYLQWYASWCRERSRAISISMFIDGTEMSLGIIINLQFSHFSILRSSLWPRSNPTRTTILSGRWHGRAQTKS
jgi:hypothetical protein